MLNTKKRGKTTVLVLLKPLFRWATTVGDKVANRIRERAFPKCIATLAGVLYFLDRILGPRSHVAFNFEQRFCATNFLSKYSERRGWCLGTSLIEFPRVGKKMKLGKMLDIKTPL